MHQASYLVSDSLILLLGVFTFKSERNRKFDLRIIHFRMQKDIVLIKFFVDPAILPSSLTTRLIHFGKKFSDKKLYYHNLMYMKCSKSFWNYIKFYNVRIKNLKLNIIDNLCFTCFLFATCLLGSEFFFWKLGQSKLTHCFCVRKSICLWWKTIWIYYICSNGQHKWAYDDNFRYVSGKF